MPEKSESRALTFALALTFGAGSGLLVWSAIRQRVRLVEQEARMDAHEESVVHWVDELFRLNPALERPASNP